MTMRRAASLALLGAVLLTILLVIGFVLDLLNVLQGLIPALRLVTSSIYAFAGVPRPSMRRALSITRSCTGGASWGCGLPDRSRLARPGR